MNFYFPNVSFSLENLLARKINQKNFTDSEKYIATYVQNWFDGLEKFTFQTSGSTGKSKLIHLSQEQLAYSASSTLNFLYPDSKPSRLLLGINPKLIGGTQVITRAILSGSDLIYEPPSANPLSDLSQTVDLVSLVPLQVQTILKQDPSLFNKVGTVLIGGASINEEAMKCLAGLKTRFFQTYGMTETASNVALRALTENHYTFIGDIEHRLDDRSCLTLKGAVTNHSWLQTNDMVELTPQGFRWLGRADWVINSGGIKINPEEVESKIQTKFPELEIYITKDLDEKLGEKMVLCSLQPILNSIREAAILDKYELPKQELILKEFPRTSNGKINRLKLQKLATIQAKEL